MESFYFKTLLRFRLSISWIFKLCRSWQSMLDFHLWNNMEDRLLMKEPISLLFNFRQVWVTYQSHAWFITVERRGSTTSLPKWVTTSILKNLRNQTTNSRSTPSSSNLELFPQVCLTTPISKMWHAFPKKLLVRDFATLKQTIWEKQLGRCSITVMLSD